MVIALKNDGIKSVCPITDEQIKQTEKQVEKIISSLPLFSLNKLEALKDE